MDHPSVSLSYDLLKEITNDFSEERKIGSGSYGRVYKGVHKDGKTIAVKLLHDMPALDDEQFKREFNNLMSLEHDNIVRLVGYCDETRKECAEYKGRMVVADRIHRALCFEYAHNGSLHDNLFDEFNGHDWRTRYGIIKGICNGLKYLHEELKPPMHHLDLKPDNVLLDENMLPKIADFGLSRLFGEEQTKITKNSIGTCGYLPPEFIEKQILSSKFDIFSLGVVVIKVMAGPGGYSRCVDMPSREFVKLVHSNWKGRLQRTLMYALEPYYEQVKTCIEIALRCVEVDRHERPTIRDIVDKMNETEINIGLSSPIEVLSQEGTMPSHIPYDLLKNITDGFSEERKLGSGGYGKTYKGLHKNGEMVAVKLLYDMPGLDDELFIRECINLMSLQHDNLVRLVGYCNETRREFVEYHGRMVFAERINRALCFEYAQNGSLHNYIYDEYNEHDWRTSYGIIKGICNGLKFLHQELKPPMYHLDLKPANVLLDENMLPKMTDFGLSRLFGDEQTRVTQSSLGTMGYVPPEYIENGLISNKFDIFSLGIVIIKVMAGPQGYARCADMSSWEFVELVQGNWKDRLQGTSVYETEPEVYYEQVKTCIEIALRCVEADRHKRPGIIDIVDKMNETETKIRFWIPQKAQAQSLTSAITSLGIFEYSGLADATDRFSKDKQIGEGTFAKVYKGSYIDENGNQEVVVKKMMGATGEFEDLIAVLQAISGKRHINLVELKGWCYGRSTRNSIDFMGCFSQQKGKLCIVYELVPNGNLEDHLHYREKVLPWENRYQIVKGIGSALRYLHHECYVPILHRNIMPSNVLLDHDFNAKLAGFRLSIIASQNNAAVATTSMGKNSYMDPQFMKHGEVEFNCKTDVYSFGIVLLEIACTGKSREEVRELYRHSAAEPEVMEDAADPKLGGDFDRMEMERVIVLGLRCSHRDSEQRPSMVDAMKFLMKGIELPALTL